VIGITVGGASRKTFGCTERQSTLLMARSRCAGGMKKNLTASVAVYSILHLFFGSHQSVLFLCSFSLHNY